MKTLTCREMGGMCDESHTAGTMDEMIQKGMEHVEQVHPEMAASINSMPKDHPEMTKWFDGFKKLWEETPNDSE